MLWKKWWNYENLRYDIAFILFVAIFANLYPISRFGGIKYQISQGDAVIQGSCLRYDAEKQILIGTPFINGFNCWNAADFLVIIAPFGLLFFSCVLCQWVAKRFRQYGREWNPLLLHSITEQ